MIETVMTRASTIGFDVVIVALSDG